MESLVILFYASVVFWYPTQKKTLQIYGHIINFRWPPTFLHDFMSTIHYKRTNKTLTLCHQFIMRENPNYPSHLSSRNLQLHHFIHHFGTSIKQLNCVTAFLSVFSVASGLMLSLRIIFLHAPLKIHVCKNLRHPLE